MHRLKLVTKDLATYIMITCLQQYNNNIYLKDIRISKN